MFMQEQSHIIINLKKTLFIFNLTLLMHLLFATNCFAQLNPLAVSVSMHGDVKVALPLPFMYLNQSSTVLHFSRQHCQFKYITIDTDLKMILC
jgi:hypothetical protein